LPSGFCSWKSFKKFDTDSITIDIPARDIRKLLNKIMKKNGKWNLEILRKFIRIYQSENPLSFSEWTVFPHLFLGAMNKFYYKRDKEWSFDLFWKTSIPLFMKRLIKGRTEKLE